MDRDRKKENCALFLQSCNTLFLSGCKIYTLFHFIWPHLSIHEQAIRIVQCMEELKKISKTESYKVVMICVLNLNITFRPHLENQFSALEFSEICYEIRMENNGIGSNLQNNFHGYSLNHEIHLYACRIDLNLCICYTLKHTSIIHSVCARISTITIVYTNVRCWALIAWNKYIDIRLGWLHNREEEAAESKILSIASKEVESFQKATKGNSRFASNLP